MLGQGFMVDKTMMMMFVIIVFLVVVFFIGGLGGGLQGILQGFCESNPGLCGGTPIPEEKDMAYNSVRALACAVDVVGTGSSQACLDSFKSETSALTPSGDMRLVNKPLVCQYIYECRTSCDKLCEDSGCTSPLFDASTCKRLDASDPKAMSLYECGCRIPALKSVGIKCNADNSACTVLNFELPQDTSSAEDWIQGYGDPKYLAYWQAFPQGEDAAWNSRLNWVGTIFDIGVGYWVGGKVISGAKYSVIIPIRSTRRQIETWLFNSGLKNDLVLMGNSIEKKVGTSTLTKLGLGGATGITLAAAYLDSITEKSVPKPDSLVLKTPYIQPDELAVQWEGKPILLDDRETSFYLASPCAADLTLEKKVAKCSEYDWNFNENIIGCDLSGISNLEPIADVEMCRNTRDLAAFFNGKDLGIPQKINSLGKDGLGIWNEMQNGISVRDPISKISFTYEKTARKTPDPTAYVPDTFVREVMVLKEMRFESSEGLKTFRLDNSLAFEDGSIRIGFDSGSKECGSAELFDETRPEEFKCSIDFSVTVKDQSCGYCNELAASTIKIDGMVFSSRKENVQEGNEDLKLEYKEMVVYSKEESFNLGIGAGYGVVLRDTARYSNDAEAASQDGIADMIGIDYQNAFTYTTGIGGFPDKVVLKDLDFDGSFDFISQKDCRTEAISIDATRISTGERNFCFVESTPVQYVLEWSPVIGSVIGGAAGLFGGPFAELSVPGGIIAGQRIGATVYGIYRINTLISGASFIWPGEVV